MAIVPFSLHATYKGYAKFSETLNDTQQAEWDSLHDGDGDGTNTAIACGWDEGESWDRTLYRAFLGFDTSSIDDDAVITSAYLKISGSQSRRNYIGDCYLGSGSQGSSIENSDYEDHVTTTNYGTWTKLGAASGTGSTAFTNTTLTLNTAGKAAISKTGVTTFSWRTSIDQSDSGYTHADSYNHVGITSATLYVTYQVDETKELTDTITITNTISKSINKAIETIINIIGLIPGHGWDAVKELTDTIPVIATNVSRIIYDYFKTLTESVSIVTNVIKKLNGVLTDIWTKVVGKVTSWTKTAGVDTTWTKNTKSTSEWDKEESNAPSEWS